MRSSISERRASASPWMTWAPATPASDISSPVRPDVLKIDISLCRSIESDRARQVIAATIASLGRELEAMVVAEGIETPAELTTVREVLGIDTAQAFHLARPAPPPLEELVAAAAANGGNGVRAGRRPSASA